MKALLKQACKMGILVVKAKNSSDANRIAIHLLNPNCHDFENALHSADRDGFTTIVLHTNQTWMKG